MARRAGPGGDSTPPDLTNVSLAPKRSRVAKGTKISFTLSEFAAVAFVFERVSPGRRSGRKCVKPTRRNRSAERCTRYAEVGDGLVRRGEPGANTFKFSGRVNKRTLAPGNYRLSALAVDAAENEGKLVQRRFKVVR